MQRSNLNDSERANLGHHYLYHQRIVRLQKTYRQQSETRR